MEDGESDNDFETMLEKSIDEQLCKKETRNPKINEGCPMDKFKRHTYNKRLKSTTINRVEEKIPFNKRLLPEGWVRLFHQSGMYYYFHVSTRVVTWSMPYQLQLEPGKVHRVPVRSIPCLSYLSMKEGEFGWDKLVNTSKNRDTDKSKENCDSQIPSNNCPDVINGLLKEENKEEGEVESSDDESKDKSKLPTKDVLPKRYQIDNHKVSSNRHNQRTQIETINHKFSKRSHDSKESPPHSKRQKLSSHEKNNNTSNTGNDANKNDLESTESTSSVQTDAVLNNQKPEEVIDYCAKFLELDQFRNYCDKLFTFTDELKQMNVFVYPKKRNKTVSEENINSNQTQNDNVPMPKSLENNQVPHSCTKKIKIPNKNTHIELAGRGLSCILNMYCQNAFGVSPVFDFNIDTGGSSTNGPGNDRRGGIHDFQVQCQINGTGYGIGEGKTKKLAKQKSVLKTLEILIPGFSHMISDTSNSDKATNGPNDSNTNISNNSSNNNTNNIKPANSTEDTEDEIFGIFDSMDVTDPRVLSYSIKLNMMTPHDLFLECINRHCISDSQISSRIEKKDKHNMYHFKVGDKEVEVVCENKREGRQLAAQYMLEKMHPHIRSWGGILRLYGPGSKPVKRFDMVEMQNLLLEDRGGVKNNLINLLRRQMLQLHQDWNDSSKSKSKAKFKVPFDSLPVIVYHPDSSQTSSITTANVLSKNQSTNAGTSSISSHIDE